MNKYFWDFFGPRANGTAVHFERHLNEFLAVQRVEGCSTGLESSGEGHYAVFCLAPETAHAIIEKALRPRRLVDATL